MTLSNYISLNEVITIRGLLDNALLQGLSKVSQHCWHGICLEAVFALRGRSALHGQEFQHSVYEDGNVVLIYRAGYVVPHFISLDWGQTFYCPWWQFDD